MSRTFVKLPTGDFGIEYIREMHDAYKNSSFIFSKWFARPALVDKKSGTTHLYSGQRFDGNYFDLVKEGWTHDHCEICSCVFSDQKSNAVKNEGYFDNWSWICKECYEIVVVAEDLETVLSQYEQDKK